MDTIPLLHVGQTALPVTTLDLRLVPLAALALFCTIGWIWFPSSAMRRWLRRRFIARTALCVLVFLAVLPSILPYDHLLPMSGHSDAAGAGEALHVSHCHVSPGSCSDAPVTSGPGQLLAGDPLIVAPAMIAILLVLTIPALTGISRRPEPRPPLSSATA